MKTITVKDGVEVHKRNEDIENKVRKILHYAYLLDASGSMNWRDGFGVKYASKYDVALKGIKDEIDALKSQEDVDIRISVFEFDSIKPDTERITEHYFNTPVSKVNTCIQGRGASGNTPLYQSLGYVIEKYLRHAKNDEPVVINIFTDGAHNCFWGKYGTDKDCKSLIADVEKNRSFTVTFMGTEKDVEHTVRNLGVSVGNTYSYDGSAKGLETGLKHRIGETMSFMADYAVDKADWDNLYNSKNKDGKDKVQESTSTGTTTTESN